MQNRNTNRGARLAFIPFMLFLTSAQPLIPCGIQHISIHQHHVYLGTGGQGLWHSTDEGQHWRLIGLSQTFINTMVVSTWPRLSIGTSDGLWCSSDPELHWQRCGLNGHSIEDLQWADGQLYAATPSGLFAQQGQHWRKMLNIPYVQALVLTPLHWYAGTAQGLYYSSDHGKRWQQIPSPWPESEDITALAVSTQTSPILYVGTANQGVYRFQLPHQWVPLNRGLPQQYRHVRQLIASRGQSSPLYVLLDEMGVFKSLDQGQNWQPAHLGIQASSVIFQTMAQDADSPYVIYLGTFFGGLYKSRNSAQNWQRLDP